MERRTVLRLIRAYLALLAAGFRRQATYRLALTSVGPWCYPAPRLTSADDGRHG